MMNKYVPRAWTTVIAIVAKEVNNHWYSICVLLDELEVEYVSTEDGSPRVVGALWELAVNG